MEQFTVRAQATGFTAQHFPTTTEDIFVWTAIRPLRNAIFLIAPRINTLTYLLIYLLTYLHQSIEFGAEFYILDTLPVGNWRS